MDLKEDFHIPKVTKLFPCFILLALPFYLIQEGLSSILSLPL